VKWRRLADANLESVVKKRALNSEALFRECSRLHCAASSRNTGIAAPRLGPDDALVGVRAAGIWGSDLHGFLGIRAALRLTDRVNREIRRGTFSPFDQCLDGTLRITDNEDSTKTGSLHQFTSLAAMIGKEAAIG
jgi:hypothetical protein